MLRLSDNPLNGTLPAMWAQPQVLPALLELHLASTRLSGVLPDEWGGGSGLRLLQVHPCCLPCVHSRLCSCSEWCNAATRLWP